MLDVTTIPGRQIDIPALQALLSENGIRADIDDHGRWSDKYKRAIRIGLWMSGLVLFLIGCAVIGAGIFATRAALTFRQQLMDAFQQVGASPSFVSRLFAKRFAITGLQAGLLGALGALLISTLTGLLSPGMPGGTYLIPASIPKLVDILLILTIPLFLALLCAITTARTVTRFLKNEIYP